MLYVGIDIASEKHECCILDESRGKLESFSFPNNKAGFEMLYNKCRQYALPEETKIGLESTGIYGDNLTAFLRRNGYETCTFNPLLIKKSIQATTLRKTKTDKSDASFLATYLAREPSKPDPKVLYHISELKSLCRERFFAVKQCSKMKTRLKGLIVSVFPEFLIAFSDVYGAAATALLHEYPSAKLLAKAEKSRVVEILTKASKNRFGETKADELIALAKESVGCHSAAKVIEIQYCLEEIALNVKFIRRFEKDIRQIMTQINSPITTIPGIGYTLGAMILSELGDITRFSKPEKILSFAGMEPSVYQSGKYTPASGSMVKRGSPYLRWALSMAAREIINHDARFAAYYRKKSSEGKPYNVACSHVAKKLVRLIFALLKKDTPYSLFSS